MLLLIVPGIFFNLVELVGLTAVPAKLHEAVSPIFSQSKSENEFRLDESKTLFIQTLDYGTPMMRGFIRSLS